MKDGLRFVDSDMHIMEPPDLFERYLDPKFKDRVSVPVGADGRPKRGAAGLTIIDGLPTPDTDLQQYRKRVADQRVDRARSPCRARASSTRPARLRGRARLRPGSPGHGYGDGGRRHRGALPTAGLGLLAPRQHRSAAVAGHLPGVQQLDPRVLRHSPDQLKFVAMLPVHDVHLACRELVRCVRELGAVGSFIRPNLVNGHYWHSNYWDPLYSVHEELT